MSASNFRLRVTAGPSYDRTTHTPVPVNTSTPLTITTPHATTTLHIRLSDFRSSPSKPLPHTHSYFSHPSHTSDLYSFQLSFSPSDNPISGEDLVWGNDFDKPIRDLLPIGFSVFWNLAKWIDPGLDGDLYADTPWVWGNVLSSMNIISVVGPGDRTPPESEINDTQQTEISTSEEFADDGDTVLQEDMTAVSTATLQIPQAAAARKKFFLDDANRREVVFRKGWKYGFDFFGPWLDFAKFEIKLPGYGLNLLKYWDGQPVRYVLRNKKTGDVYACVLLDFVEVGTESEEKATEGNLNKGLVEEDID